jgi:hypothetical protein
MKHPYFLLLQEMFSYRGISLVDAYLNGTAESTWRSYKSGWNTFVRFLVEQKYTLIEWESNKECDRIYLEFLNWVFVGETHPSFINKYNM